MSAPESLLQAIRSMLADAKLWSLDIRVPASQSIAAALGMTVPIVVGAAIGRLDLGMLASLGSLAVSGAAGAGTLGEQGLLLSAALLAGSGAILVGSSIAGHGWITGAVLVLIITLAALLGGLGRTLARCSTLFMVFLIIGTALGAEGQSLPLGMTFVFMIGAAWTLTVSLLASSLFQALERADGPADITNPDRRPASPTMRRRFDRWFRSLHHLAGWQYPLRIGLCVLVAEMIAVSWNQQWSYWIPLVVVIIVQRKIGATLVRASQRAIGTCAGVVIGSIALSGFTPAWLLVLVIGVLAAVRPVLRARSYTLYTVAMTPLIVMLLGFGAPLPPGVLVSRLLDTGIGFLIVVVFGYLLWPVQERAGSPQG